VLKFVVGEDEGNIYILYGLGVYSRHARIPIIAFFPPLTPKNLEQWRITWMCNGVVVRSENIIELRNACCTKI